MCALEGTSLKIYRPAGATGVSAIGEWWEKVGVGDDSNSAGTTTAAGGVELRLWLRRTRSGYQSRERKGTGLG